jgi:spore coat protein H
VDEIAAAIRALVQEESETKLARFDKIVAGEAVPPSFGPGPGPGGPRPEEGRGGPSPGSPGGPGGARFEPPQGFMQPARPIKGFVKVRAESVSAQLSGKEKGETMDFGFGPGGGRGGPRFGPAHFIAPGMIAMLDRNADQKLSRDEFVNGFENWFQRWDKAQSGALTEEQLRNGLNETFVPPAGGPGGGGGPVVLPLGGGPRPPVQP